MDMINRSIIGLVLLASITFQSLGQNPIITDRFTADPTARVFEGRLYVYPSSDTVCARTKENNGFCMQGYHVYSTDDLTNWTDHGDILNHNTVPWVKPNSYGMWAPDCNYKNGKYYFYFPAIPLDGSNFRNIGVAISDSPTGPFTPEPNYMEGVTGIDPNVFVDDDGSAFLYFGGGEKLYGVELNEDMVSIKGKPQVIMDLPSKYKEGPFVFKREGIYYFTFPHAPEGSEEISYAMGDSPLGPFKYQAKVLERWKNGLWTNHHSFVEFRDQWYLFYHSMEVSNDQHRRSVCVDRIYFDDEGKIPEIKATKRGIGNVSAADKIEIDRYSVLTNAKAEKTNHEFVNWIIKDVSKNTEMAYNDVDFGKENYTSIVAYVSTVIEGGQLEIFDGKDQLLAVFDLPKMRSGEWRGVKADLKISPKGMNDLIFKFNDKVDELKIDWIQFVPKNRSVLVSSYDLALSYRKKVIVGGENNILVYNPKDINTAEIEVSNASSLEEVYIHKNGKAETTVSKTIKGDITNFVSLEKQILYNPYEEVLASNNSNQNGVLFENCSLGGQNAAYIENEDHIIYDNLKFDQSPKSIDIKVACKSIGGLIEIRKNGTGGEMIGQIKVTPTGGYQSWETLSANITGELMANDKLYFVFKGDKGFLFNMYSFSFK
ncbi:MAG: family 43 glycosylhydrolase [Reichenbachiella sp.]